MKNYYLSPHLDDAALSCGGSMAVQVQRGEYVRVINFFAGVPDLEEDQFSPYAQKQHRKWELKPKEAVIARRLEDQQVLKGIDAEIENWDYYDAIYRDANGEFLYTDHQKLFGPIHPREDQLVELLTARLEQVYRDSPDIVFYAPLWVGGHVDHLIARECAIQLHNRGAKVVFYEDFPYIAREDWRDEPNTVAKAVAELPFKPEKIELIRIDPKAKIKALTGYRSQMMSLFEDWEGYGLAHEVLAYTSKLGRDVGLGKGNHFERYWHFR